VLFLGLRPWDPALYGTLLGAWTLIGIVVVLGPGALETADRGPYFGISGLWCWITEGYQVERLMLEYLWMFVSAFTSFVLYALVFLKLRGNIVVSGWTVRVRRAPRRRAVSAWDKQTRTGSLEAQLTLISKQMMLYPIAYTILILPIAACRYAAWAGHEVPFQATIFSDVVFLLSGFVNTVLFVSTRRILPDDFRVFFRFGRRGSSSQGGGSATDSEATLSTSRLAEKGGAPSPAAVQFVSVPVAVGLTSPLSPRSASKVNANIPPPPPPKDTAYAQHHRAASAPATPHTPAYAPALPPAAHARHTSADAMSLSSFASESSGVSPTAVPLTAASGVYNFEGAWASLPPPPRPRTTLTVVADANIATRGTRRVPVPRTPRSALVDPSMVALPVSPRSADADRPAVRPGLGRL